MSWVAPRDIAEVPATVLLNPSWHHRRVQAVHGPEDLTWAQVAEILSAELGRKISVARIHDDEMRRQYLEAGMPAPLAEAMLGMSTGLRDGFAPEQRRSVASTTPTSLRTWDHAELATAL